jgi:soluble lytic murein transglycosylase
LSIHLLLAAAAMTAAQGQAADPLAPLPSQPAIMPPPVLVPVQTTPPAVSTRPINAPTVVSAPPSIGPTAVTAPPSSPSVAPVPGPLTAVNVPRNWTEVFGAIRRGRWAEAQAGIAALPRSVLTPVAKAELYTAKGSPVVSLQQIQALLAEAPDLPEAEHLARMAITRGALATPQYVPRRAVAWLGNSPTRYKAKPIYGEPAADQLRTQLDPLIKADDATNAELLLMQSAPYISYEARAEAGQRVAWSYFAIGRDADARRVADSYRQ